MTTFTPRWRNSSSFTELKLVGTTTRCSSKKNAYETKDRFFDSFSFSLDDVYRALDYFRRYSHELQKHLHAEVSSFIGRNSEKAYYLMDPDGIPMAFHTFSGNGSGKANMLPAIQRVKKDYEIGRIIVVADRGTEHE